MPKSTPARSPSRWNGLSREERQRERRDLLIDAAFDLLASDGGSGTTVRAVCATARLNPRYFYESFTGIDELVVAVYDRLIDEVRNGIRSEIELVGGDAAAAVRATVTAVVRYVDEDRRRGRVLYVEGLGNGALNVRRMQTGFALVELLQRDVARRRGGEGDQQLTRLTAALLVGAMAEIMSAWIDGRIDMTADQIIDDTTELFLALGRRAAKMEAARLAG